MTFPGKREQPRRVLRRGCSRFLSYQNSIVPEYTVSVPPVR